MSAFTPVQAVQLWEDTVGDSGRAPTDAELLAFAEAVAATVGTQSGVQQESAQVVELRRILSIYDERNEANQQAWAAGADQLSTPYPTQGLLGSLASAAQAVLDSLPLRSVAPSREELSAAISNSLWDGDRQLNLPEAIDAIQKLYFEPPSRVSPSAADLLPELDARFGLTHTQAVLLAESIAAVFASQPTAAKVKAQALRDAQFEMADLLEHSGDTRWHKRLSKMIDQARAECGEA